MFSSGHTEATLKKFRQTTDFSACRVPSACLLVSSVGRKAVVSDQTCVTRHDHLQRPGKRLPS